MNNFGINCYSRRGICMVNKKIILLFVSLLLISSVNVGSSNTIPAAPNLAEMVQMSDIIVECTVVDIEIGQVTWSGMGQPYQNVNITLKVNEILKPNQVIEIGDDIVINRIINSGGTPNLNTGDHAILIELSDDRRSGYPRNDLFIQEGEIYSTSDYQISLEDMKTFAQKSDDYLEKYGKAYYYDDIVVAKILTNTDANKMEYTIHDDLPHQTHKTKVIYSASGKFTSNVEFDYVMWYFPEKILQEIDYKPYRLSSINEDWIKTSEGYYSPSKWDPKSSFLKKGDYYIIYVGTRFNIYGELVPTPSNLEYIEKYDSKTKNELKEFIEEYQEIYELVQKYEKRRESSLDEQGSQTLDGDQNEPEESSIPGFSLIFAIAAVVSLTGLGIYHRRKKQ